MGKLGSGMWITRALLVAIPVLEIIQSIWSASGPSSWAAIGKCRSCSINVDWLGCSRSKPFCMCGCRDSMRKCLSAVGLTPRAGTGMPIAADRFTSSSFKNSWNCTVSTAHNKQLYCFCSSIVSDMMRSGRRFLIKASTTSKMPVRLFRPPTKRADGSREKPA